MKSKIKNLDELKGEIARLTALKHEQETYLSNQYTLLKDKIEAPARIANNVVSSIPGVGLLKGLVSATKSMNTGAAKESDWMTQALRIGLPLVLNRTFLRNSSWAKKALVLLASETAAQQMTQENVSGVLSKLAGFIRPKKSKKKEKKVDLVEKEVIVEIVEDRPEDQILGI